MKLELASQQYWRSICGISIIKNDRPSVQVDASVEGWEYFGRSFARHSENWQWSDNHSSIVKENYRQRKE